MTTKLAYQIESVIEYDKLGFDPDEPEPLPDAMFQYPIFQEVFHILDTHITNLYPSEDVFRSSNTFICYDPTNLNVRVGPDFYAAFGVDSLAIKQRKIYLPWEVGKPPDFVLEVASESTAQQDMIAKRQIYAQIGIPEYWRFDPTGGDFYGQPLAGDRLVNHTYEPMELTAEPDGILKGYSQALRLSLCGLDGMLKFYNHETNSYLRNLVQTQAALTQAEARVHQLSQELERRQSRS